MENDNGLFDNFIDKYRLMQYTCDGKFVPCPLILREIGIKIRYKKVKVTNYKKPPFRVIALAMIACIAVAVCFLTNPASDGNQPEADVEDVQDRAGKMFTSLVIDTASLDIDGDSVREDCSICYGPTSGIFSITITASVDGIYKYRDTFFPGYGPITFGEKNGVPQITRDGEYHKLYVGKGHIVIEGLE